MFRTRQWRRAQNRRILRNYLKYTRLTRNRFEVPGAIHSGFWVDKHSAKRSFETWEDVHEYRDRVARFNCNTRTMCSGICCGNPRRWFGEVTKQELRSDLNVKDEV
jgi:hypothetical protein